MFDRAVKSTDFYYLSNRENGLPPGNVNAIRTPFGIVLSFAHTKLSHVSPRFMDNFVLGSTCQTSSVEFRR